MPETTHVVWENTVDNGAFHCKVVGDNDNPYKGQLVVTVHAGKDVGRVLLDEPVGISFGAPFGPDVADVAGWQDKAITAIDAYIATEGAPDV